MPLTVNYDGYDVATIALPPLCAAANAGIPTLTTDAQLTITDQNGYVPSAYERPTSLPLNNCHRFASFATYLLHNPEFTWTVHSNNVTVSALGFDFLNVQLSKEVSFKGLNNLPGVTISNFQLVREIFWLFMRVIANFRCE